MSIGQLFFFLKFPCLIFWPNCDSHRSRGQGCHSFGPCSCGSCRWESATGSPGYRAVKWLTWRITLCTAWRSCAPSRLFPQSAGRGDLEQSPAPTYTAKSEDSRVSQNQENKLTMYLIIHTFECSIQLFVIKTIKNNFPTTTPTTTTTPSKFSQQLHWALAPKLLNRLWSVIPFYKWEAMVFHHIL